MIYDLKRKQVISKLSIENEGISHFETFLDKNILTIISVTDSQIIRKHCLEFDNSLESRESEEIPELVSSMELNSLKLFKFKTTKIKIDPFGKFIILIDSSGQVKIIMVQSFKTVREGKVGFGPVKTRLFKDYILNISKDRIMSIYDVKKNKKHKTIDLTKYSGIDTQYFEFIILDDKMRYFINLINFKIYSSVWI